MIQVGGKFRDYGNSLWIFWHGIAAATSEMNSAYVASQRSPC